MEHRNIETQTGQNGTIYDNRKGRDSSGIWFKIGLFVLLILLIISLSANAYYYYYEQLENRQEEENPFTRAEDNGLNPPEVPEFLETSELVENNDSQTTMFTSEAYNFSFEYPQTWSIEQGTSQIFESGDLVTVFTISNSGTTGSPTPQGARFTVMEPVRTESTLTAWIEEQYARGEQAPRLESQQETTINGIPFTRASVCDDVCIDYYFTLREDSILGFMAYSASDQESLASQELDEIISSFTLE